ncbi:C4-dicarboxylate ABC transporter (plasmid) [Paroceanicella profunda]|uniref:C4-dicarboxylate ABC transporter n=1 Tax=Paroceanicella profunda TaxID=2579971 RepID=A0A5B8G3Q8_9RHOB|nr:TRAP transporter substrate-binding protein DctP [Paroceanicella profunda]QDL94019.1 C4-dicarboxylate ABC transporter [Paroceanicella profunda]
MTRFPHRFAPSRRASPGLPSKICGPQVASDGGCKEADRAPGARFALPRLAPPRFNLPRLAAAVLGAALLATGPLHAEDKVIRFSTAGPAPDFLARSMETFAADVAAAKVGVSVEVYPGSSLVRQGAEVPALQRGTLQMSTMNTFEVSAQIPRFGFLNRAFLFRDYDHMMKVMAGPVGAALEAAVSKEMDIEILSVAYLGTRQVNLRTARDVAGPDDLKGVRMRMPASPEWLLLGESLGVSPTPMGMSEVYVSLQTGAIDGQENPLTILRAAKFNEVTEQVVLTAHLVQPVFFAIAKPFWDALSPEQQEVVRAAALAAAAQNNASRYADEQQVAAALKEGGLRVDAIDLAPFRARADAVYAASDLAQAWDADLLKQAMAE